MNNGIVVIDSKPCLDERLIEIKDQLKELETLDGDWKMTFLLYIKFKCSAYGFNFEEIKQITNAS